MAFDIGFCGDVESVLVAEFIPAWVVGIVAGTNGIDVQLLHDADVLNHAFNAHHIAAVWVQFMTVGTLDEYGFAVD